MEDAAGLLAAARAALARGSIEAFTPLVLVATCRTAILIRRQ
jgi:hypothetical protein